MATLTIAIESLCEWSDPRQLTTRSGPRILRTANPTEEFWTLWRADKSAARAAGLGCGKDRQSGDWQVQWWQEVERDEATIEASAAASADIDIPAPDGCEYLPYQKAGIKIMATRANNLLADEMGLGKTIQALGLINMCPEIKRVLIICPASLKRNWRREARKWLCRDMPIRIIEGGKVRWLPTEREFTIINYDILAKHSDALRMSEWGLMILDESHNIKNGKTARTKQIVGWRDRTAVGTIEPIPAARKMFLTGTPVMNKPIELWTTLRCLVPDAFPNWRGFVNRYCSDEAGYDVFGDGWRSGFGGTADGASNLGELSDMLRQSCMVRRLKSDVLTELPPKRRQVLDIADTGAAVRKALLVESRVLSELAGLPKGKKIPFSAIAAARRDTSIAKAPEVVAHIKQVLDGGTDKVVVFAHHHAVMDIIESAFGSECVRFDGMTPFDLRERAVVWFQTDPSIKVFIGNIKAAGTGITLTAAAHVIFAELPWTPAELVQAEDRCHRIGQLDHVLVQALVVPKSIDARMAELLTRKAEIVKDALDSTDDSWGKQVIQTLVIDAPPDVPKPQPVAPEFAAALLAGLRHIAAHDQDHVSEKNDVGFSLVTHDIGHSLARCDNLTPKQAAAAKRILTIHKRQVPAQIAEELAL